MKAFKMRLKTIRHILLVVVVGIAAITAFTAFRIHSYASVFSDSPSDAAIILGAAIWNDKPSPVFKARIDHGINLHKQGKVKTLVFTGGVGTGEVYAESEVAKQYAMRQGIAPENILIETRSQITFENLTESKLLLGANNINTVLLVSDPLHMKRAMTMTQDLNINAASSPTPMSLYKSWRTKSGFLAREVFYYIGYLLFGWG